MTMARAHLVDPSVTRWYHCVTRCVRRAFLLGEGEGADDRKLWIERRLQELADIFAVAVGGFSVMDNHLHVLVRLDPDVAKGWSDEQVVRRWGALFPPRDKSRQALPVSESWVQWRLKDEPWVAMARTRLQSLSWFMKCLKEPLSRLANRQDKTRGAFFEGRFIGRAKRDPRTAGQQRRELAGPDGEAEEWPAAGAIFRGQSRAAARGRCATGRASSRKPGRMLGAVAGGRQLVARYGDLALVVRGSHRTTRLTRCRAPRVRFAALGFDVQRRWHRRGTASA